jgi:methionine biosynthesis protein MetW
MLDASTKPRLGSPVSKPDWTMTGTGRGPGNARVDHLLVAEMIERDARVLDVGCGDGALLKLLESRGVEGRGIELSREGVNDCVAKGLAVIQGDADADLADYPADAFDYVILSQTLQATRRPRQVLQHMLRIGRHAVVSFPNFGHWRIRLRLLFGGQMPRTDNLPDTWYDTPNIHFCTIKDFRDLCEIAGVRMERAVALDAWGRPLRLNAPWWFWNLFGEQAVFLLGRGRGSGAVPAGSSAVIGERRDRAF